MSFPCFWHPLLHLRSLVSVASYNHSFLLVTFTTFCLSLLFCSFAVVYIWVIYPGNLKTHVFNFGQYVFEYNLSCFLFCCWYLLMFHHVKTSHSVFHTFIFSISIFLCYILWDFRSRIQFTNSLVLTEHSALESHFYF